MLLLSMIFRWLGVVLGAITACLGLLGRVIRYCWDNTNALIRFFFWAIVGTFGLGASTRVIRSAYAIEWPQWGIHIFIFSLMLLWVRFRLRQRDER